jgi:FixJ family two-component response regulator
MSQSTLIIDDEAHVRRMMRLTLETAGYTVGEAADGPQGLVAFADGTTWDVVLLDQKMPGMDGLEVLRRMQARAPTARVIMVTAFASIELAVEAMKLGATDFMRKPMTPEILRNTVAAALAKSSGTRPGGRPATETVPRRPRIEMLTMNGFHIVRAFDLSGETPGQPGEYRFIVQPPKGGEQHVVVEISPEAVAMVAQLTRRPLPLSSSFWASYAERTLATYLWDEGRIPSSGLTITQVELKDVDIAARWEETLHSST